MMYNGKNILSVILLLFSLTILFSGCACKYHDLKLEIIKEATCLEDGTMREYCTKCDYSVEESFSGSHNFREQKVIKTATCSQDGESIYYCSVCRQTENRTTYASHSFSGRICTDCGYKKPLPELSIGMLKHQVQAKWGVQ